MRIKQRITIAFGLLVATILFLFSIFIYQAYETNRRSLMKTRLQRRALAIQSYFKNRNEFWQSSYLTLLDQHESLFDSQNKRVYSTSEAYVPSAKILQEARKGEVYFSYNTSTWEYPMEGVALSFINKGEKYVAIVTAYDLTGRQTGDNLILTLIAGNNIALVIIVFVGFLFAQRAMQPFDRLIRQINGASVNDFSFRLQYDNTKPNEASYLADAFNLLLNRLQQSMRSHEHFIRYASHEIRTPLTVVKGMLETSLAYDKSLATTRESTEKALVRLEGAIELATVLLQLTEVEGLKDSRLQEDINVVDTILDTMGYFQEKYPSQLVDLQLSDAFIERSSVIKVVGNNSLLRTVLINIIDNACKYSAHQPVLVQLDYQPHWTVIEVVDKGIGIPESQLDEVFLPMMRAENVGDIKGFGLGLTLANKVMTIHQGKLEIQSVPNQGTTVSLSLPTTLLNA
ncbi:HAMP domain-containing sensor histidine kinase [Runella sp. SP2]|uniref:sensor histidine kinase n=1 Tax=Runella sp. SP2 TaxID=2268026 RepID=UPI000F0867A9|nr:HAMP domain-containing sensor histidine kinase [Runella sp. SP2]AYQ30875.1 sensor histidine kinase [Runella sp. SP2]